jgi:hypothetical protein
MSNPLPEQAESPPSKALSLQEEIYEAKVSQLRDHLGETMAALEHIGEAQSSINYVDPSRYFITHQDIANLWDLRSRLGKLRQHFRDELELRGENPDEER